MKTKPILHYLFLVTQIAMIWTGTSNHGFAQSLENDKVPEEQRPIEEREATDSFIENVAEVPGEIVTLPLKVLFHGIRLTARWIDFQGVYLRATDLLTSEDGTRKVRPIFAPSGGGGVTFIQENFVRAGMVLNAHGSFGIRSRRLLYGKLSDARLLAPAWGLQLMAAHQRRPDEDFFGVGNDSPPSNETNYLQQETHFEIAVISAPVQAGQFSFGLAYSDVDIGDGREPGRPSTTKFFSDEEVPGLEGAEMWSLLFKFYHDSRNATGHPTEGGEAFFSVEFARELNRHDFGYRKYTLDLRRYVELFYQRVLAVRLRTEVRDKMSGRAIPFDRLSGLGGTDNLRGYRPFRFVDEDLMLLSAEYRFPVHAHATVYGFFEEGRVFNNIFDEFSVHDFKYAAGGGLRLTAKNRQLVATFEMAKSKEQMRFVFGLNTDLRRF